MVSICNCQVMILICLFLFSLPHFSEQNEESLKVVLDIAPKLKSLNNVKILLDNEVTSLSERFGPDVNNWTINDNNAKHAARIIIIGLSCDCSDVIALIINESSKFFFGNSHPDNSKKLSELENYRRIILKILSLTLHYSKVLHVRTIKPFFMGTLATHFLFNKTLPAIPPSNWTVDTEKFNRIMSYIKYSFEVFRTEFCAIPTFDISELSNAKESSTSVQDDHNKSVKPTVETTLSTKASYSLDDLGPDETKMYIKLFSIDNLLMKELVETELIQGEETSSIKHLDINFHHKLIDLNTVREYVTNEYYSENVVKYQSLLIDCISSIAFRLISKIIKEMPLKTSNDGPVNESINNALSTLQSLGSNGILSWASKSISFTRMKSYEEQYVLKAIAIFFKNSNIKVESVDQLLRTLKITDNPEILIEILNTFIDKINQLKKLFFIATDINIEQFDFSLDSRFQFFEPNDEENLKFSFQTYNFALFVVKHLNLSDNLVLECKKLAVDTTNGDYNEAALCFSEIKHNSNKSLIPIFKLFYGDLIKSLLTRQVFVGVYYKLFEAMYSLLLYLNNLELYNITDSKVPSTSALDLIITKANHLLRFHEAIAAPLEYFIKLYYSIRTTQQNYDVNDLGLSLQLQLPEKEDITLDIRQIVKKIKANIDIFTNYYNNNRISFDDDGDDGCDETCEECGDEFDSESDEDENLLSRFSRFSDYGYLNLSTFLFEEIIISSDVNGSDYSFLNEVRVAWVDETYLTLRDMYELVKTKINSQYIYSFNKAIQRILIFTLLEKLKDIVKIIKFTDEMSISEDVFETIFESLYEVDLTNIDHTMLYSHNIAIRYYLEKISNRENKMASCDRLIDIIKEQQNELGVEFISEPSSETDTKQTDTVQSLNDSVEKFENYTTIIKRFVKQYFIVQIIGWKKLADLTIV